jgi:hypothetical protein
MWKKIDVWDEALAYFDWENTRSVKYSGYLLNHTQKLAVDLADYHKQSKFLSKNWEAAIDLVPVLTETGEGAQMALDNGISVNSTEKLVGTWHGDLLQIVDVLPENYNLINCCFAEIWSRAEYCYRTFGLNEDGYLLNDDNGNLFEATRLSLRGERQSLYIVKVETNEEKIRFIPIAKQAA